MLKRTYYGLIGFLFFSCAGAQELPLHQIKLPPGFQIQLYSDKVPNARSMSMSPAGTLFVGSRRAGKVYALVDRDQDARADEIHIIADNLNMPNGVAFHKGDLYVAEVNRVLKFQNIEMRLSHPPKPIVISTDFPSDEHHGWKFIRIGPDEKLYVPIGAPCNVCLEYGYASITRLNLDGSAHETYAKGVRNTVGFDWHPESGELWFTDNGRDMLGDDLPPDELNRASDEGQHFGFPYCHAGEILDPDFGLGHNCSEYVAPVQKLDAHVASLGMRFYTGKQFPEQYKHQIFIAEHGSWNRSKKAGYRITMVTLVGKKAKTYEVFAQGWLQGQKAWGRPVDIEHMADGSLLVSDDKAGAIYRISFQADNNKVEINGNRAIAPKLNQPDTDVSDDRQQILIEAPIITSEDDNKKDVSKQETKTPVTPEQIHESIMMEKRQQQNHQQNTNVDSKEKTDTQSKKEQVPPADVVEKIRQRTEEKYQMEADPFSPVNKETVPQ